jgi:hypothetical protein
MLLIGKWKMKYTKSLFISSICLISLYSNAQNIVRQNISSAGEYHRSVDFHLSYTLGESVSFSVERDGFFWKAGFQQADFKESSMVWMRKQELISVNVWPNPIQSGQSGYVSFDNKKQGSTELRLIDLFGKIIWAQKTNNSDSKQEVRINFSSIQKSGVYFIGLFQDDVLLGLKPWIIY